MRDAFVKAEFQALGIDHDHANLARRRLIQDRHDQRIQHHALAGSGRAGDQQVRHRIERGHLDAAVDVLAQRDGQRRRRSVEFVGFQNLAQADHFALRIGDFDADRGFSWNAFDENRFGLKAQAEILTKRGDARVFDAGFGLEFESRHHRARD